MCLEEPACKVIAFNSSSICQWGDLSLPLTITELENDDNDGTELAFLEVTGTLAVQEQEEVISGDCTPFWLRLLSSFPRHTWLALDSKHAFRLIR